MDTSSADGSTPDGCQNSFRSWQYFSSSVTLLNPRYGFQTSMCLINIPSACLSRFQLAPLFENLQTGPANVHEMSQGGGSLMPPHDGAPYLVKCWCIYKSSPRSMSEETLISLRVRDDNRSWVESDSFVGWWWRGCKKPRSVVVQISCCGGRRSWFSSAPPRDSDAPTWVELLFPILEI